jgi:hypothetical protein
MLVVVDKDINQLFASLFGVMLPKIVGDTNKN